MQSLTAFFEDNKPLAIAAAVAAVLVLLIVVFVLIRLLFGRRPRAAANGRNRQPRLGIVDAYELDRQRQLVLVRRDNVEHLIMIGGPTDVVIESSIVRTQASASPRDKEGAGSPPSPSPLPVAAPAAQIALPPATANLAAATRTEPSLAARGDTPTATRAEPPTASLRGEPPPAGRTEPPIGTPMPSPAVDRTTPDRGAARPVAVPDPAAPSASPPPPPEQAPPDVRSVPPRPSSLPPRPAPPSPLPHSSGPQGSGDPVGGGPAPAAPGPSPERVPPPRTPLPPRPPLPRQPLPPRPSLASSLPPRRPLPIRPDPPRPEQAQGTQGGDARATTPPVGPAVVPEAAADQEPRRVRITEPASPRVEAQPPTPVRNIESLESLEEEMAKLLGRPAPRRDG